MVGILIVSHGNLVNGLLDSLRMFFGEEELQQIAGLALLQSDDCKQFGSKIDEMLKKLDTGDGVIILADMLGGTPCNQSLMRMNENMTILSGINLPMLMELVYERKYGVIDIDTVLETGKEGITNAGARLLESTETVDDD